jgi:hypothetical protein
LKSGETSVTKQFCDRCGADVTNKTAAAVKVIGDADTDHNGQETDLWDLCPKCYAALKTFISLRAPGKKR